MGTKHGDTRLLPRVAAGYFDGLTTAALAQSLRHPAAAVEAEIEALEAVLILAAHELPEALMPRAVRLPAETVGGCLREIRSRLGSVEGMRQFIAEHPGVTAPRSAVVPGRAQLDEEAAPSEDAEQALAVLDFWASKWL